MLKISNLVKVYPPGVTALRSVTLDIERGMFGLLGPNGAGKSTLMRIVAGLLQPTSGAVSLDGDDIVRDPSRVWECLGYLPQAFGMYPHLTGAKMLSYLLKLKGVTVDGKGLDHLVAELLERVNLQDAANRPTKSYSGGMLQRLGIAQAIAGDPKLIIVDEPTAGLDPEERLRLYRILAELARDRIVLLSTHIVEDVAVLCSRLAIIRSGEIVASTTPAEAKAGLAGTIYEGVATAEDLERLTAEGRVLRATLVEGVERVRIHQIGGELPVGFESREPTLEDAYLNLMRDIARPRLVATERAAA